MVLVLFSTISPHPEAKVILLPGILGFIFSILKCDTGIFNIAVYAYFLASKNFFS